MAIAGAVKTISMVDASSTPRQAPNIQRLMRLDATRLRRPSARIRQGLNSRGAAGDAVLDQPLQRVGVGEFVGDGIFAILAVKFCAGVDRMNVDKATGTPAPHWPCLVHLPTVAVQRHAHNTAVVLTLSRCQLLLAALN